MQQQIEINQKQRQHYASQGMQSGISDKANSLTLSSRAEKIILKLDDGHIIGSAGRLGVSTKSPNSVVMLNVEQALEAGKLGPKDAKRLYDIIQQLPGGDPLEGHAQNIGNITTNKRKKSDQDEATNKRPKSGQMVTTSAPTQRAPTQPLPVQDIIDDPKVWTRKCENILKAVQKSLGPNVHIFNAPVKAAEVPDYYKIIKNPMDLGTIGKKLKDGSYNSPIQFQEDMRLVWSNCKHYNGLQSPVGSMGYNASMKFEDLWTQSGLEEGMRARRTTAGIAAHRFDPDSGVEAVPTTSGKQTKPKQQAQSGSRSKTYQTPATQQRSKKQQQEANSQPQEPPSTEIMQEVLGVLQELVSNNDDALGEVIEIIRSESPNAVPADQVDEFELDIEVLEAKTLWKLYNFIKQIKQQKKTVPPQQRGGGQGGSKGVRVQESDSGSSMESDEGDEESDEGD
eukprot:TRINITY_DN5755_c0_g2_i1.p1 TRINITY_DN5755_c0_g2~~TRINITY_DN5755_c0_g2_i1.p1  ORF type:complete len:512 (-),score=63.20 TRINITY_DN5755_c0_g2_i1:502-1860(-)